MTPSSTPSPLAPSYRVLTETALKQALVGAKELPLGYSQIRPDTDDGNRASCGYTPFAVENIRVGHDFIKGGGTSTELLDIKLRQFKSTEAARAAWKAMTRSIRSCKGEVYEGTRFAFSQTSAPKLGDAATGVKIEGDGRTLLQDFALVGPVIVSAGGGGVTYTDADVVSAALKVQVQSYIEAAQY